MYFVEPIKFSYTILLNYFKFTFIYIKILDFNFLD
jgi:hypothetical protein